MKTIKLVLYKDRGDIFKDSLSTRPVWKEYKVPNDFDAWGQLLNIDDEYYETYAKQGDIYAINKLENYDEENGEEIRTDEIKCPACGKEIGDSWEMDDKDEIICDCCGSKFKYERIVNVTYNSELIERNEPIELKEEINK